MKSVEHHLVTDYLREFDTAASAIPLPRRTALRREIRSHLREAIPATLSDGEALIILRDFGSAADIVAQEVSDPLAASNSARRRFRPLAVVAIIVASMLLLTGALPLLFAIAATQSSSIVNAHPSGSPRVMTGDAYFDYIDTIKDMKYPLPPGASYPAGVPTGLNSGPQAKGVMEFGGGSVVAHFTWLCAWEVEYLQDVKHHNVAGRVSAERMLTWWGNSDWWDVSDPTRGWNQNVVEPMRMGDSSGVKSDAADTCAQAGIDYDWDTASRT